MRPLSWGNWQVPQPSDLRGSRRLQLPPLRCLLLHAFIRGLAKAVLRRRHEVGNGPFRRRGRDKSRDGRGRQKFIESKVY